MELFASDRDQLAFLLETDAALDLDFEALEAQARDVSGEEPAKRPSYITNYIGSKQKLVDWIWKHTPGGVSSVLDAFSGSAIVAYMYKTKASRSWPATACASATTPPGRLSRTRASASVTGSWRRFWPTTPRRAPSSATTSRDSSSPGAFTA